MNRLRLVLLVSAMTAVPAMVRAQEVKVTPSNEERAEALFQLAEKKFDTGRIAEACADWEMSLRLGPKLGTLLNLALCHETVGRLATAWAEYNHGAAWAAQNGQRERHDFALQHALALEGRLPRVVFQLPVDRAFAAVEIDGEPLPVPRAYLPQYLDPGEHTIAVTAPGKKRSSTTFRVVGAGTEQIVLVPSLVDEAPPPKPPPPPKITIVEHPIRRGAGFAAIGLGAAGVVVGSVFGGIAVSDRDTASSHCMGNVCDQLGASHYRDAQAEARVATIGIGLGLVAIAVGGALVWTGKPTRIVGSAGGVGATF